LRNEELLVACEESDVKWNIFEEGWLVVGVREK
jgi:hypothetical protein